MMGEELCKKAIVEHSPTARYNFYCRGNIVASVHLSLKTVEVYLDKNKYTGCVGINYANPNLIEKVRKLLTDELALHEVDMPNAKQQKAFNRVNWSPLNK